MHYKKMIFLNVLLMSYGQKVKRGVIFSIKIKALAGLRMGLIIGYINTQMEKTIFP